MSATELPGDFCAVGVASNSPDSRQQVADALRWLAATFTPAISSAPYATSEWSGRYPRYVNAVALLGLAPYVALDAVNASLKLYERRRGRVPSDKASGIVPIDLDILVWRGEVVRPQEFTRPYFADGYRQALAKLLQQPPSASPAFSASPISSVASTPSAAAPADEPQGL